MLPLWWSLHCLLPAEVQEPPTPSSPFYPHLLLSLLHLCSQNDAMKTYWVTSLLCSKPCDSSHLVWSKTESLLCLAYLIVFPTFLSLTHLVPAQLAPAFLQTHPDTSVSYPLFLFLPWPWVLSPQILLCASGLCFYVIFSGRASLITLPPLPGISWPIFSSLLFSTAHISFSIYFTHLSTVSFKSR